MSSALQKTDSSRPAASAIASRAALRSREMHLSLLADREDCGASATRGTT